MATIVSITPLPLRRDSRALKTAASFARFGHRSIVVQGGDGALPDGLQGVELVTVPFSHDQSVERQAAEKVQLPESLDFWNSFKTWLKRLLPIWLRSFLLVCMHKRELRKRYQVRRIKSVIPKADIYYVHSWEFGRVCLAKAVEHNASVIYDAHDLYSEIAREDAKTDLFKQRYAAISSILEQELILGADRVITVCDGIAKALAEKGAENVSVLRNCHDFRLDAAKVCSLSQFCGAPLGRRLTGVVIGNNKAAYPLEELLRVARSMPKSLNLVFLGRGFEECARKEKERGTENIFFPGACDPTAVVPLARQASFSIVPYVPRTKNDELSLPNKFFQSLAAGLPVIVQRLPEMSQLAEEFDVAIALDKMCFDDIMPVVEKLLTDSEYKDDLSLHSLNAAKVLNWEEEEKKLLSLIDDLAPK